jgi:regulator of PEP synthase PpsR (kinase-PPPase family)
MLDVLAELVQRKPVEEPGRYRELHREHFGRIDAIEYAVEHDNGARPEDWHKADVLLLGASRVGKHPHAWCLRGGGGRPQTRRPCQAFRCPTSCSRWIDAG